MNKTMLAAPLMGLLALGGCARVRYPDYYTLNLPGPIARGSRPISASVTVREFQAPQYLARGPIVYRPDTEEIAFYDYHRWAEDPRRSVTAVIVRELGHVFESASSYEGHEGSNFLLTGSLDRLEEVDRGSDVSVEVGLSAKLQNLRTGELLWSGTSSKTSKVEQRSIAGIVAEMSHDLSDAATELVSSMRIKVSQRLVSSR